MDEQTWFRRYIYNLKCLIVFIICVLIGAATIYLIMGGGVLTPIHEGNEASHTEATVDSNSNANSNGNVNLPKVPMWENNQEIEIYREYLRIPTVHPDIDYKPVVDFLEKQAESLDLPISVFYPVDDKNPVVVITWEGTEPELPSIMLNSHMDVVPVFEEFWTHPPFGAEMDANGDIFARGAQDTKCVGTWYLAAIRALKRQGVDRFKRTVHVVFVPDEELGGTRGMAGFVRTSTFKNMNFGFALDEGSIIENDEGALYAYYGERSNWKVEFIVHGTSGHGSRLFPNTPGEKLTNLLVKLNDFRNGEMKKLTESKGLYGNITSINLTILKGGVQNNVVPAEVRALFDMRISIDTDPNEFEQQLKRWCEEAGGDIMINFLNREEKEKLTDISDSNPFWMAFKNAVDASGLLVKPYIVSGNTDARFIRRLNIPAIGFSPQLNTTLRQHDHNEYLNAVTYLNGIETYEKIITNLANV